MTACWGDCSFTLSSTGVQQEIERMNSAFYTSPNPEARLVVEESLDCSTEESSKDLSLISKVPSKMETTLDHVSKIAELKRENLDLQDLISTLQNAARNTEIAESKLKTYITKLEKDTRDMHHRIQVLEGQVRVHVRVRPFLDNESCSLPYICCSPDGYSLKIVGQAMRFRFDKVFSEKAGQNDVFEQVSSLVKSALNGCNVCVFSYGPSGSGKVRVHNPY